MHGLVPTPVKYILRSEVYAMRVGDDQQSRAEALSLW